ncbi:hypothetical protein [Nocardia bhagyanarayanae]|uniref:DUF8175 domain-containing protein n=1 Tax=Nocardia bhagyanarayanae TaxID=1215925 RepID=A0A543FDG4_9NOCA|nr:hypothetical protein [Nocardia bhagyanarayanae]TQM31812.1 hypothetical protein FB390_3482 [Nocardia bhagyanarayanae]
MVTAGPVSGRGRAPLPLLGFGAALAVAIAVGVTVSATRDGSVAAEATATGTTEPIAGPPGPHGLVGFAGREADLFGRPVDVPVNPAGVALAQVSGLPTRPDQPDWLTAAPAPAEGEGIWQKLFGGPVVRFFGSDGPARIEGNAAVGFAHTPRGAALAAEQIYWRTNANPRDRDLLLRLVEVSPEYLAEYDRLVADGKVSERIPEKLRPLLFASDAYRIESYADDSAIVRFARKARETVDGQPTWVGMRLAVVWRDGDWKLRPVTGEQQVQIESLRSIEGWTRW